MNLQYILLAIMLIVLGGCSQYSNMEKSFRTSADSSDEVHKKALYTFSGIKDPALTGEFVLTYVASNQENKCKVRRGDILAPKTKVEKFSIDDGHYIQKIYINIQPEDGDACAFKVTSLNLILKRESNKDAYNRFPIFGNYPSFKEIFPERTGNWAQPIYNGDKYGHGSELNVWRQNYTIPYTYRSDKNYFSIAPSTQFNCMTFRYDNSKNSHFLCFMDISDSLYSYKPCKPQSNQKEECGTLYHPEFSIDELKDTNITLNIYTDKVPSIKYNSTTKQIENDFFQK